MNGFVADERLDDVLQPGARCALNVQSRRGVKPNEPAYPGMVREEAVSYGKPKLPDQLRDALRARHYSPKTEKAYSFWVLKKDNWLMASLMYGAGLRLTECIELRVQNLDFSRGEILVRNGKGAKDRFAILPESLKAPLAEHLEAVRLLHEKDLSDGWGRVFMPDALGRKYSNAAAQ